MNLNAYKRILKKINSPPPNTPTIMKKILIVDDDELSGMNIQIFLEGEGFVPMRDYNGANAIETVKKNPDIDLILMDWNMPVMKGNEATKQIKALYPHIPIISTTSDSMETIEKEYVEAGFDGYLQKPFRFEEIEIILKKYLK